MNDFDSIYQTIAHAHTYEETENGVGFFRLPLFSETGRVLHGLSARTGGVSEGGLLSLNLSFSRPEEKPGNVLENYRRFASAARIPYECMVMDTFEHGTTVTRVNQGHCGSGYIKESLPFCDGLVTNDPGVTLVTGHADCLPLYFYDPVHHAIGLAHAGWKGTYESIAIEVIRMMALHFSSHPKDLLAGIGAGICGNCFEVDETLMRRFDARFADCRCTRQGRPGKGYVDLARVTVLQFLQAGILPAHIAVMDVCTVEEPRLYSHRRDHGNTGGMSAYLKLLDDHAVTLSTFLQYAAPIA